MCSISAVELREVTFRWRGQSVLDSLSFQVLEGEVFALIGESGCGKSTTLRLISGLARPERGDVFVYGRKATEFANTERPVITVWQSGALFPHLSVSGNIEFGLVARGIGRDARRERVEEVARLLHIEDKLLRDIRQLSGGERQRVAMARALVLRPQILLLDEPFTGLDELLKLQLQVELKELQKAFRYTYILVSHSHEDIFQLADRIAIMRNGRIEQVGKPEEILSFPASSFVARFIGRRNLIPGELVEVDSKRGLGYVQARAGFGWWGRLSGKSLNTSGGGNETRMHESKLVNYVIGAGEIALDGSRECVARGVIRAHQERLAGRLFFVEIGSGAYGETVRIETSGSNLKGKYPYGTQVEISWHSDDALVLPP